MSSKPHAIGDSPSAASLLLVALAVGALACAWQAVHAHSVARGERHERQRETELREEAESQLRAAEARERRARNQLEEMVAVLEFVQKRVCGGGWSNGVLNKEVTLRQALDAAAPSIEEEFAHQPLAEATARCLFAAAYQRLDEPTLAIAQLERGLALRRARLGDRHAATLSIMNNLAVALRNAGQLSQATSLMEETLQLKRDALGSEHAETFLGLINLAWAYHKAGQTQKALPLWEEALTLQQRNLGPAHPDTLGNMGHMATIYHSLGDTERAAALLAEATRLCRGQAAEFPDNTEYKSRLAALLKLQAQHSGQ